VFSRDVVNDAINGDDLTARRAQQGGALLGDRPPSAARRAVARADLDGSEDP
jgi:hypothetical protein